MTQSTKKVLGFWMLTALVAGNMIGSGLFMLPASLAKFGSISLISWGVTTIGAICLALVFASLSRMVPESGGPYKFVLEAFGRFPGFQMAYSYWIALWIGNAAIVVAFVGYLTSFFPALQHNHADGFMVAMVILWGFTFINILGLKEAGVIQIITTILKLVPIIMVAVFGIAYVKGANLSEFNVSHTSNFTAISSAAILTMWSFVGLESATIPAGAVNNPTRNIPRATIVGTLIAASVYIVSTAVIMGIIPSDVLRHSPAPFADAARIIFGGWGEWLVAFGAIISCAGALNGWILLQGQVPIAASEDNLFPKIFEKTNSRGAPVFSLVLSSGLITLLLAMNYNKSLVNQFTLVILLATLASIVPYIMATMARISLHLKGKGNLTKGQMIRAIIVSSIAFIYIFWVIAGTDMNIVYYGMLMLLSSVPVYVLLQWRLKGQNAN